MLNSAAGVMLPGPLRVPPMMATRPTNEARSGSRFNARAMLVSGPRATRVTASGAARTSSQMIFSEGCCVSSSATRRLMPPSPSIPCRCRPSTGRPLSGGEAAPTRGQRGGSTCSMIAWTLRVASCGGTLPPTAVTATTSSVGSNSATQRAMASSIPGSQSRITFLDILPPILPLPSPEGKTLAGRQPNLARGARKQAAKNSTARGEIVMLKHNLLLTPSS